MASDMVSIFNKYLSLYYNEVIRKNLTARKMIKKTGRYSPTSKGSGHRKHEGGTDMNGIGIGIISLLVYIAAILVINMVLKRNRRGHDVVILDHPRDGWNLCWTERVQH